MDQLPYGPDDDNEAREVVGEELKRPNPERWLLMITDDRIVQTDRALDAIIRKVDMLMARRKHNIAQVRADFNARNITDDDRRRAVQAYEEWKTRTIMFRTFAVNRRAQIAHRVRQLGGDLVLETALASLRALALAVADHQTTLARHRDPTPADRLLWMRLDTLTFPVGTHHIVPLTDIVKNEDAPVIQLDP